MTRLQLTLTASVFLAQAACSTLWYAPVPPGVTTVGDLHLAPVSAWNLVPDDLMSNLRRGTQVWTQDGVLLDSLFVFPGIADGEALFEDFDPATPFPQFGAEMSFEEIAEVIRSSIALAGDAGATSVRAVGLRRHQFGQHGGFVLDLDGTREDGPDFKGLAGAFISEGVLHVLFYLAAEPYYYTKHIAEARPLIESATL